MERRVYDGYVAILKHELKNAMGCTEPIALAYASAKAREILGKMPDHIDAYLSGNIIKNVQGVIVPNSDGQRGTEVAAILGCLGGDASRELECIEGASVYADETRRLAEQGFCESHLEEGRDNLYIRIEMTAGDESAIVAIEREHSNIIYIEKNGKVLKSAEDAANDSAFIDKSLLNLHDILSFAREVELEDVRDVLINQIRCNVAISEEGLNNDWGAEVGKEMMKIFGDRVEGRAAARAAAGSDARMGGCSLPVVINSGSGNQGITLTMPIYEYAVTWKKSEEEMLRALALADLIAVHIKRHIGNLSAFCGAVSAGCASSCGVAFMDGCSEDEIGMIITNALCNVGGMVCDGAKSSCAAKIASSVQAGLLAYRMAKNGRCFQSGEGIVGGDIENTIRNIGRMGREGMKSTDVEILNIMLGK